MLAVVWIDGWQLECCGEAFAVGDTVDWTVSDQLDRRWLETVVGAETAHRITHAEDHHDVVDGGEIPMSGRVRAISSASCGYAPSPTERRALVAVPGTAVLTPTQVADGRGTYTDDVRFNGYVVELEVVAAT